MKKYVAMLLVAGAFLLSALAVHAQSNATVTLTSDESNSAAALATGALSQLPASAQPAVDMTLRYAAAILIGLRFLKGFFNGSGVGGGIFSGFLSVLFGHSGTTTPPPAQPNLPGLKVLLALALPALLLFGSGCTFQREVVTQSITPGAIGTNGVAGPATTNTTRTIRSRIWDGYIIESSSTMYGADIESPSGQNSGTIKLKLGFGSEYERLTPTSSSNIVSPNYVSSQNIRQSLTGADIGQESASGNTFYTSTNTTAGASVPGTPTPQQTK